MYRRKDRSGDHLSFIRGGRAAAGWHYGFDEPRLQNVSQFTHLLPEREPNLAVVSSRFAIPEGSAPRSRLRIWLFDKGGMCVVLIGGLLLVAIVGGSIGR